LYNTKHLANSISNFSVSQRLSLTLVLEYATVVHGNRRRLWLAGNNNEFYKENTLTMLIAEQTVEYTNYHGSWPSKYQESAIEV